MSVHDRNGSVRSARMAATPVHPGGPVVIREEAHIDLFADLLGIAPGPTHIAVVTADSTRGYGMLGSHSEEALRELDVLLDSRDAANEDANGRLAHEYRKPVIVAQPPARHSQDRWTREAIIDCIQAWHAAWGRPPLQTEWRGQNAAGWPAPSTVKRHYGTWRAGIEAAGYLADPRGRVAA